jgi:hypothetical protein
MNKKACMVVAILLLNLISYKLMAQTEKKTVEPDTLCILWTSGDPDVALKMVFMYANAARQNRWWSQVELIVWGPSAKLTSENTEIQQTLAKLMKAGVKTEACKACADSYGVSEKLEELGIEVKYMGQPLTEILKSNKKLVTF